VTHITHTHIFKEDHYRCQASSLLGEQHMHCMQELENEDEALQILHLFRLVNNASHKSFNSNIKQKPKIKTAIIYTLKGYETQNKVEKNIPEEREK
jgi:hypothetical protein